MQLHAVCLAALIGLAGVPPASRATTVKVDFGTMRQIVRAAAHVAFVGGHLYGSNQVPAPYRNAMAKGKEVWMTQNFIETPESVIATALSLAVEINNSMAVGQYSAYVYCWLEDSSTSLIGLADVDGNITTNGAARAGSRNTSGPAMSARTPP